MREFGTSWETMFVREVDGRAVDRWYQSITAKRGLSAGTAVRHFNVMHHMMGKAAHDLGARTPALIAIRPIWWK